MPLTSEDPCRFPHLSRKNAEKMGHASRPGLYSSHEILRFLATLIVMAGLAVPAMSQTPSALSSADEKGVDATLAAFGTTLTQMDFAAFATLWTEDCDFVNIVGMHWVARRRS